MSSTILVVDDDYDVCNVVRATLEHEGYHVLIGYSGEEAVRYFRDNGQYIALVVMDVVMPGIGGLEAARQILELDPDAKIAIMSGTNGPEDLDVPFLQKPFRLDALTKMVEGLVDGRQKGEEVAEMRSMREDHP
jgi:CheY-like chemotaxis protein